MNASESRKVVDDLLVRYLPGLRAYVRLRAGPAVRAKEATSDLVQSVCREILEDKGRFEFQGESAFRGWLFERALWKIRDRARYYGRERRKAARERPAAAPSPTSTDDTRVLDCYRSFASPSRQVAAREELGRVERAFDGLPERYREVITLTRILGLPHAEAARRLGCTEAHCRVLLSRALARLTTLLGKPSH